MNVVRGNCMQLLETVPEVIQSEADREPQTEEGAEPETDVVGSFSTKSYYGIAIVDANWGQNQEHPEKYGGIDQSMWTMYVLINKVLSIILNML